MEVSLRRDVTQRFVMFQWTIGEMQFVAQYGQGLGSLPCAYSHVSCMRVNSLSFGPAPRCPDPGGRRFRSVRCGACGAGGDLSLQSSVQTPRSSIHRTF